MLGVLAERVDQAHLVEAMDGVLRRHGGTPRIWRTDRLASVIVPGSRDVQASFAPVAKHYGAVIEPCPPRRGNRKGVVEAAVRFACGRWWRTLAAGNATEAQLSLDRFCATTADERLRPPGAIEEPPADGSRPRWPTVAERADAEASAYQDLRAHLSTLRLGAAAEALPAELEQARADKSSTPPSCARC